MARTQALAPADQGYQRDLGDGLRVRWSTADDTERIAYMSSHVFRRTSDDPPNEHNVRWIHDLMSGRHPLMGPVDYALVEDTQSGAIVAATNLLAQVWEYGGIAFGVGRPELVATDERYRNRGLIRAIFELIHARSAARGHLVQGITGIEYFYRQFGYEYALELDTGRTVAFTDIPSLKADTTEPFRLRPATLEDVPLLQRLYAREQHSAPVTTLPSGDYWRWILDGMDARSGEGWDTQVLDDADGRATGYVLRARLRWHPNVNVWGLAVLPEVSLVEALPSLLRALRDQAPTMPTRKPDLPPATNLGLILGSSHPVYDALGAVPSRAIAPPYAWYIRVPELPRFMRHIAPVLERRLADSVAARYNGDLKLNFYRGGLRLLFEAGRLTLAEDWRRSTWETASAGFPPGIFLQLLFGHRGLDELRHIFPDVSVEGDVAPVLRALFPAQRSFVRPLD
ncbi:MAG TPA: GNAT family N-acetyltransferase [Ktedonobacterales bacterium]|nr:GNAT family N-acetyltransferase [Ktedonobacterales bacterium]